MMFSVTYTVFELMAGFKTLTSDWGVITTDHIEVLVEILLDEKDSVDISK